MWFINELRLPSDGFNLQFSPEYQCTSDNKPKGDLNTLRLERTSESEVKVAEFVPSV